MSVSGLFFDVSSPTGGTLVHELVSDSMTRGYRFDFSAVPRFPLPGRETRLIEQSEYVYAAFPDVSITVDETIAEGELVAQRSVFRGTHEGEFMGIEPTGEEVEIAERWLLADTLGLMEQLRVVEPPGE